MVFRRDGQRWFFQPRSSFNYERQVGDGSGSSTVAAPVLWVARTFPEAPPALWRVDEDGQERIEIRHPLLRLMQRPNPFYTGVVLWMATTVSWMVDGNAYWFKLRNANNAVTALWWVPSWMLKPVGNEGTFITHYEYQPGTELVKVAPEDVVHFRFGLDADNPRLGYSPLKSVLREVYTDDEAAAWTASLLRNMGVPGLIVSPASDTQAVGQEDLDATKQYLMAMFTGDKRGEPMVMGAPTRVEQFGFSPEQMNLKEMRRIPEERVTAVLGIPAIVAGLGAGLDRSTFTNMAEAREAAYEAGIIPMQRIMAEEIRFQLLTDFEQDVFVWRFGFDLSKVRVLQEDVYRQAQRLDLGVRGGWATVADARRAMGLKVTEEDEVFLRQLNIAAHNRDGSPAEELSALPVNGNGNGNGGGARETAEMVMRELEARN